MAVAAANAQAVLAAAVLAAAKLQERQDREFDTAIKLLEKEELQVDGKN